MGRRSGEEGEWGGGEVGKWGSGEEGEWGGREVGMEEKCGGGETRGWRRDGERGVEAVGRGALVRGCGA